MHAYASFEPADLASQVPTLAQRRFAKGALLVFFAVFVAIVPFARIQLAPAVGYVAAYGGALVVTDVLTALLLIGQLPARRSSALLLLAMGYLFSAVLSLAHVLSFPGLLGPSVIQGNSQLAAVLYLCWHALFPVFVIAYSRTRGTTAHPQVVVGAVLLSIVLALVFLQVSALFGGLVPELVVGYDYTRAHDIVVTVVLALNAVGLLALWTKRPRMLLDLWLIVAMSACVFEIGLSAAFNDGRFDLGFYAGRLYGLAASLFVLGVLAMENLNVYARLRATFEAMIDVRVREKSNLLVASVLQQLPEGVVILDRHHHCVLANERAAALAGAAGDRSNMTPDEIHAALTELVGEPVRKVADREVFKDEIIECRATGPRRMYSISRTKVHDDAGAAVATVLVLDDVTERIDADRALHHAYARTRALLENTPLAAIELDRNRIVRIWNSRAEELFGWPAEEVIGKPVDMIPLIYPGEEHAVDAMLSDLLHHGSGEQRFENRNITRDGRVLQCEWYNSVLFTPDGQVDSIYSLALDVTERKAAMDQLRDADRRKDEFIATLAHELRNPLAPIANAASLLLAQKTSPERIEWIASMISRQSARMARLLDDLLDVTRISRGKVELRRETLDIAALVRESLQTSMPLIETGRHHLDLHLPADPVWIEADPLRIAQVVSNLVNNAAKYTHPGGVIAVRLESVESNAVFSVADNGIGIEQDMLGRVFDAFVQSGCARELAQGGLGIGLSLARGLVELHGGSIAVHSDGKDRGSVFTVTLPLAAQQPLALVQNGSDHVQMLNQSILVADDNEDAADSLAMLLRARGAYVEVAHDGEEALQLFRAYPAQIAILDLGMPRLGGLELARELAQSHPRPYLVALTGRGRNEDRIDSLKAGFDEHLTKPVAPQQLIDLLARVRAGQPPREAELNGH
jgi:PAS domain S-box-containing protein